MEQQFLKLFWSQRNSISYCYLGNSIKDIILRQLISVTKLLVENMFHQTMCPER